MPQSVLPRGFGSALSYRATRFRCLLTLEQGGVERVPVDELVEDLSEVSFVFLQHLLRLEQRVRELAPRIAEKNRSGPRRHWDRRCLVFLGLHACQEPDGITGSYRENLRRVSAPNRLLSGVCISARF
jgi:hypothetical protein